ncbi:MAG: chloride channel protein [Methylotenera sp.]|nr:chloride channel protein [Oligoflexia bacterium]
MVSSLLTGLVAAVVVSLASVIRHPVGIELGAPIVLLAVTLVAMFLQRFTIDRHPGDQRYDGLSDLFIHIHLLSAPDSSARWTVRGVISFLLRVAGGAAGPEGAATELAHGLAIQTRSQSSHWFEQRRRTDVGSALAAGIAAAFGAPFAAVLMTIELGIGGRTLSVALSALTAFVGMELIRLYFPSVDRMVFEQIFQGYDLIHWNDWLAFAGVVLSVSALSILVIRLIRYFQESLLDLFQTQTWMRVVAGGIFLFLVALVYTTGHAPSWHLLEQVLSAQLPTSQILLIAAAQLLSIALVIAAFGTVGIFWPLFALGGFAGYSVFQGIAPLLGIVAGKADLGALLGMVGASAMWGSVLGIPMAAAVVAYELTRDFHVVIPCFIGAMVAREIRKNFKTAPLIQSNLESRGLILKQGRSAAVLDSILVRDAMVTDHETVYEHEPIAELHSKLLKSKHPFLPVVNRLGNYVGILTIDMIRDGFNSEPDSALSRLIEAKDLLYKSNFKMPTVKAGDALTVTSGLFELSACIPVLADDERLLGLLFAHNVRVVYDREVSRRSLVLQTSYK